MSLKFVTIFSLLSYSAFATGHKFWNEEINPRLKVNYLSQSNGKNQNFYLLKSSRTLGSTFYELT